MKNKLSRSERRHEDFLHRLFLCCTGGENKPPSGTINLFYRKDLIQLLILFIIGLLAVLKDTGDKIMQVML